MKEIRSSQTRTGGKVAINMWFKTFDQLFDASDPFPFPEKELSDLAEDAIFGQADLALEKDCDLTLHIPKGSVPVGEEDQLANAVRRHFSFRLDDVAREKKASWREGLVTILIAFVTASFSIGVFYLYYITPSPPFWFYITGGVFIIMNWVTIWAAYEYFTSDWRRLWRRYRVYAKISRMNVIIQQTV